MGIASRALRIGFEASKLGVRIGVAATRAVIGLIENHVGARGADGAATPAPAQPDAAVPTPAPAPVDPTPAPAVPAVPDPGEEPIHIGDDAELVGEFAEQGAEDGAGAEVRVAEPWAGYRRMRVGDIKQRIQNADVGALAVIQLYESSHQQRRSILDAVEQRSRQLA